MEENEQENGTDVASTDSAPRADEPKTCADCGTRIDTEKWHPLVTRTDEAGNFEVYAFCSDECRDTWADADTTASSDGRDRRE